MKHFYVLAIRCSGCIPSLHDTFIIALLFLIPSLSFGQSVSGTVFKDFNANGSKENTATYNEPGMPGVRVVATDPGGTLLTVSYGGSNTATTSSGSYSVTNGITGQVRLEFILPDGYTFAANAATGGTLLMFPTTATQNLAVNSPDDYWDRTNIPDPTYVIPCYVQGTITGAYNDDPALVAFKQSANSPTGTFTNGSGTMFPSLEIPTDKGMPYQVNELGTVWGVAFNKKAQTYYLSSFAKRHSGVGPQGFGAIYTVRVDNLNTTATFSNKTFFNLEGVTAAQGGVLNFGTITRTTSSSSLDYIADTPNSPSYDLDAYAKVGRMSYGDVDFQESSQKLFATNLFQRSLLEIDASSDLSTLSAAVLGSKVKSYTLSALSGAPTCPNGILRPWALKIYKEQGYIGLVCDASGSQNKADLRAYVMRFDPANVSAGLSPVLTINTSYRDFTQEWRPWSTSFSQTGVALPADFNQFIMNVEFSEPVVSDIEFDENNNMVIAIGNLAGHKLGFGNYLPVTDGRRTLIVPITHGDMLHACYNPASRSWSLENTVGGCGPNFTASQNTRQGYTSDASSTTAPGEFYQDQGGDGSDEAVMGALAKVMGTGNMLAPMIDPFPYGGTPGEGYYNTGGVQWYNTTTGIWSQAIKLYGSGFQQLYGKAFGLGDLEAALTNPPIEIGNRVWLDNNRDGQQDAGEPGLGGISVSLCTGAGVLIATTTTDTNGQYVFSSASTTALQPNTAYQVKFPTILAAGRTLTTSKTGSNTAIDSDPSAEGVASLTTDGSGNNVHTFDAGYIPATCGLSMTVTPGLCQSANNTYTLSGQVSATNVPASGTLTVSSAAFSPAFVRTLPAGNSSGAFSFSGLVSNGQTFSVTASFSDTACAPVTQTYAAPVSCSVAPVCSLTVVPTAGVCQTATNTFSSTVSVTIANPGNGGVLTIDDGTTSQTIAVGSGLNRFTGTAIFDGLPSDGSTRLVSVSLAGCGSSSATYSAPIACSVALPCSATLIVTPGLCASATNTYSATATLLVQNGTVPQTVTITVGGLSSQPITLSAGTASVTFEANGLLSDGSVKTATAIFSGTACGQVSSIYSAPVACSVAPPCSAALSITRGVCNSITNTYSATAILIVTNPATGSVTLTVADQSQVFSLTAGASNTIGFVANGMNSDGLTKTATALFSGTACGQASTTFTAPVACTFCSLTATPTAGICQTATNTFSSTVVVQISTTGAGGVLTVTDGSSSLTLTVPAGLGSFTGTATFNNLPSDGASRTVTATLPGCSSMTTTYTAPASCSVAPICSVSATVSAGLCQTAANTFSSTVVVVIQNTNSGGTLTITDGPLSQTTAIGAGFSSFTAIAIFNGLPSNGLGRTATVSLPGCSSTLATYTAPTSCSVGPELALFKAVSTRKATLGQVISYTVTLVNTGPVAATSIVVSDTYSAGISIVPNSASTSTGSFTPDFRGGMWAISSLPAGATATLTFSASVLAEGIVYNSARTRSPNPNQPDLEVQVCTTVPFTVCKGNNFAVELSAPAGFDRYQWYFTAPGSASSVQVSDGTLNSYTATQAGDYELIVNDGIGSRCAELSCCPITVEETEVPSYTALTRQPTCTGTTPQANGQITLTNLGATPSGYYYQISPGSNFVASTATPASATTVPATGILASNLAEGSYTVRVWVLINGTLSCPRDLTVTLAANCVCKPVCVPVLVRKITRP